MSTSIEIAEEIAKSKEPITLIFAFNSTGKTQLSVDYKNITKTDKGDHSGVYYNSYSEDLFRWDNDEPNNNENLNLEIIPSSLNPYYSSLLETPQLLEEKLEMYKPKYQYSFDIDENPEVGITAVRFSRKDRENIKISRGEERIFIWCFFLALFDADAWTGEQDAHIFIDDPVSSMDDNNIFITASSIMNLIDNKIEPKSEKRIIITTHHVGLFSILSERLRDSKHQNLVSKKILRNHNDDLQLKSFRRDVFLYHLYLLQLLDGFINAKEIVGYHFIMIRQVLEMISSFLGTGGIKKALEEIGFKEDVKEVSNRVNSLTHKNGRLQPIELRPQDEDFLIDIFERIQTKYNFIIHTNEERGR